MTGLRCGSVSDRKPLQTGCFPAQEPANGLQDKPYVRKSKGPTSKPTRETYLLIIPFLPPQHSFQLKPNILSLKFQMNAKQRHHCQPDDRPVDLAGQ